MSEITVQRHEEKYLLNPLQAAELERLLGGLLHPDEFSQKGAYYIRSLYFDAPDDVDYHNKILGVSQRQKLRLRLYDVNSPAVKLEIKNKRGSLSFKQTATLTRDQAQRLVAGDYGFLLQEPNDTARRAYTFFPAGVPPPCGAGGLRAHRLCRPGGPGAHHAGPEHPGGQKRRPL